MVHRNVLKISLAATMFALSVALVQAQGLTRLVEAVDANDADRNVNIFVEFNCSIRYLSHLPADLGSSVTIRLRLGGDCGGAGGSLGLGSERPLLSGSSSFVRGARLEQLVPGEVSLTLDWAREVHFVTAPTTDGRGFRLRLLEALPGRRGAIRVIEPQEELSGYAINLESSRAPFTPEQLADGAATLKVPTYVSTIELEGNVWYRLRAGPIAKRGDADRLLMVAQERYPRAWLGVNDEASGSAPEAVAAPSGVSPTVPIDPALPPREIQALTSAARAAMSKRDYPRAIETLTKLTRQPEFAGRERAQELLGLARERSGQLAHAKAEYEEYLRRYPEGSSVGRIRSRLRVLSSASRVGRNGTLGGIDDEAAWRISGGASQFYRREQFALDAPDVSTDRQSQNAIYTDGDFLARRRGERFDFISRVTAGFAKDFLVDGPGDQARVSSAFVELNDRARGIAGRLGRQSRNDNGLLGRFDGLFVSYQLRPRVALNGSVGLPVESTRDGPMTGRRFIGLAAEFGPFHDKWDFGVFTVAQQYSGQTDRRAIGIETRYFVPGRTIVGLIDYDLFYSTVNSAVVMGSIQLPARWIASFNFDHRRTPVLTTRNALIGQPVQTFDELGQLFSPAEIEQLARDRTPVSDLYSISLSRPLSERFQVSIDAAGSRSGATMASGSVPAVPESGLDSVYQVQLIASSLWRSSDLVSLLFRHQSSDTAQVDSIGLATRLPVSRSWRLGPRLRIDRRKLALDAAQERVYVPTLRIDYQRRNTWFELETGAELGSRDLPAESESYHRFYIGLGYRVSF